MKYLLVLTLCLYSVGLKADDCDDDTIEVMIAREAIKQNVSVDLALAVAKVESNYNPKAVGSHGEIGLFQIMPYHAIGKRLNDLQTNIKVGVTILHQSLIKCADMGQYAVICYNAGTRRRPKHPHLNAYYLKITKAMG